MSKSEVRRLRGFWVTGEALASVIRDGFRRLSVRSGIPETARFFTAHFDGTRNAFICIFEDESFEETPEGNQIVMAPFPQVWVSEYKEEEPDES